MQWPGERKNVEEQGGGHAHRVKRQILASDPPGGLAGHLRLAVSSLRPSTDPHMPSRVPMLAGSVRDTAWVRIPALQAHMRMLRG